MAFGCAPVCLSHTAPCNALHEMRQCMIMGYQHRQQWCYLFRIVVFAFAHAPLKASKDQMHGMEMSLWSTMACACSMQRRHTL